MSEIESNDQPNLFDEYDDSDADPTYEVPKSQDCGDADSSENDSNEDTHQSQPKRTKHPGRKRTRRYELWKRNISHKNRNEGKSYTDRKGAHHEKKQVREFTHQCRFRCNVNVCEQKRQEIFKQYWELGSWELQSAFLNSSIKIEEPRRKKRDGDKSKSLSCQFYITEHRVCKMFFLCTLDISNRRVTNVISKKKLSVTGISPRDKRGHKVPGNKMSESKIEFVKEHIRAFPRHTSHYSRTHAPNRKYLSPNLNISKLYSLYKESCNEHGVDPVKESYYRYIFNTQFNLSFRKPQTDTCITCDKLQNTITNGPPHEVQEAIMQKELHLRKAEMARQQITEAQKAVKDDSTHLAITFDLQKMLPCPVLTCSKVYYSRQLWTYNFCVHNLGNCTANMFMWHEAQAARGCEEMLSCLLKLVKTLPTRTNKITMFSDNAGGQNKSRYTVKFWLYVVSTTHIVQVDHKYLLSGHSYNDCDKNFGVIERARKNCGTGIFVPEHWMDIVAKSSNRFMVNNMENEDFISLDALEERYIQNVKGIRKMQWLRFKKCDPDTLFYKTTFNPDMPFSSYNMKPKESGIPRPRPPQQLRCKQYAPGIKTCKYKDLQELLPFIPPVHHAFYRGLQVQRVRHQPRRGAPEPIVDEDIDRELEVATDYEPDHILNSDSDQND